MLRLKKYKYVIEFMILNEIKTKQIVDIKSNSEKEIDKLLNLLTLKFNELGLFTELSSNKIIFSRNVQMTTHSGHNKLEFFKILRKGMIDIKPLEKNLIEVMIIVNRNYLNVSSLLIGLLIFIFSYLYYENALNESIKFGILTLSVIYIIGYLFLKSRISELISVCNEFKDRRI